MNINEYRKEIDEIDSAMLSLFEKRMETAAKIGKYKKENAIPIKNTDRERELLQKICEKADPELSAYARRLFSLLIELSSEYQVNLNIN